MGPPTLRGLFVRGGRTDEIRNDKKEARLSE